MRVVELQGFYIVKNNFCLHILNTLYSKIKCLIRELRKHKHFYALPVRSIILSIFVFSEILAIRNEIFTFHALTKNTHKRHKLLTYNQGKTTFLEL